MFFVTILASYERQLMKKLIVFVCNGNIYRSVIAEKYLAKALEQRHLHHRFSVASYGLQGTMKTDPPRHLQLQKYERECGRQQPQHWLN